MMKMIWMRISDPKDDDLEEDEFVELEYIEDKDV